MSRFSLNNIPEGPAVYALYEHDRVMMVGAAEDLRAHIEEHMFGSGGPSEVLREAISHPGRITEISWWRHPAMEEESRRTAARQVAVEVLAPVSHPRFTLSDLGVMALEDPEFVKSMEALFRGPPAGSFVPQSLDELARNVYELKDKVEALERRLAQKKG